MDVQANSGQCCAKFFKTRHKDIGDLIAGAVMQIGRGRLFRIGLHRLQPGQEGRATNAPAIQIWLARRLHRPFTKRP